MVLLAHSGAGKSLFLLKLVQEILKNDKNYIDFSQY